MLSNSPKNILAASVLALGMGCVEGDRSAVTSLQDGTVECIDRVAGADILGDVNYLVDGNCRALTMKGPNLKRLHDLVANDFVARIEAEIKAPGARFTIANFKTDVSFDGSEYVYKYSVDLNPAQSEEEVHKLIAMRGSVWHGTDAESMVLEKNAGKIKPWQERIKAVYGGTMDLKYELARSSDFASGTNIFHEAVLVKGSNR